MMTPNSFTAASNRAALRNSIIAYVRANAHKLPGKMRRRRRLNMESAIRRSLVGAKGLRP